ncbi:hypothetical protein Ctob_003331 [Chrysochromulina tobinii]|uniref:Uncharacterized protein n=1 Tax=Chrysochromulina tobinii TaxID=1460289 RepID=A0A0M0JM63_9EUKA|nr:hypothetical protein Ctob_003331 [Chrysochromulina tobinii]|eukprot:KOO27570.1 hypothetical protein Ctob_003331 [Chrysochromulina sp. CCMP291]
MIASAAPIVDASINNKAKALDPTLTDACYAALKLANVHYDEKTAEKTAAVAAEKAFERAELKEPLQSIGITDTREAIAAVHCTIDDELDLDKFCALILNANAAARKRERMHECVAPSSVKSSAPPCEPFSALTDPDRFPFGMVVNSNRISRMVDESMKRSTRRAARLSTESAHPLRRKVTFQLPAI